MFLNGFTFDQLWFDVGIKRYTTRGYMSNSSGQLWFDVGIKRYTTLQPSRAATERLWFDVGIKRYTTYRQPFRMPPRCGLM